MNLTYPLLSDPEGTVIKAYGALMEDRIMASRYYFLVGQNGLIKWKSTEGKLLPNDEVLEAIKKALQNE